MSKCVVSIVGAGGKTTLMFSLAKKLKANYKVLVTTTTKIGFPAQNQYDCIAVGSENFPKYNSLQQKGIYIYGTSVNDENKLVGLAPELLDSLTAYFDYILIESDGARRKLIKGWTCYEPVICKSTTHTIGVLNLKVLGMDVTEDNVHRIEEFIKITGAHRGEKINEKHLARLVFHKNGLFKSSRGEKILFLVGHRRQDCYDKCDNNGLRLFKKDGQQ
ncbi:MAG: selenium cofactor biosynthesis protein YqeC [Clostridiaceae bacterium]